MGHKGEGGMALVCRNTVLLSTAWAILLLFAPSAHACSCMFRELCDSIDYADVMLRGNILQRTEPDGAVNVAYSIKVVWLFKVEDGVDYPEEIEITTSANSAACGIYLNIGEEYLLDLIRTDDGLLRSVGLCGAVQSWTSLNDEKLAILDDIHGSCGSGTPPPTASEDATVSPPPAGDPCEGRCGEFYECLLYSGDVTDEQFYCSASCDLGPCEEGEECSLVPAGCSAGSICGNGYVCSATPTPTATDPCEGSCNEFQECLFYSGDVADDQYYCSASCDLGPCEDGEECSLVPVGCSAGFICGSGYVCSAADTEGAGTKATVVEDETEPCALCAEFQECMIYDNDGLEEFYCGDSCDPSPCENGEACSLVDSSDCDGGLPACPPVSACSASAIPADVDEETQAEDPSSALRQAVGSSTGIAVVLATLLLEL